MQDLLRHHLLDKLSAIEKYRLLLITAPPGYGKTTLIRQLMATYQRPTVWHTLTERDRDLTILLTNLTTAFDRLSKPSTPHTLPVSLSPEEAATAFIEQIADQVATPTLLVLDDVHHLTSVPTAEAWLYALIPLLPASVCLVLAGRTLPHVPLVDLLTRQQVQMVSDRNLNFTDDEIAQLVGERAMPSALIHLLERLAGWPAGVALALYPTPDSPSSALPDSNQEPEALFEALAQRLLTAQPPPMRDFLLAASTLRYLTPELCTTALGSSQPVQALGFIEAHSLFASRERDGLTLHPLFRSFLQASLRHQDAATFNRLHRQAAQVFRDQGDLDEAVTHLVQAGDAEAAATLVEAVTNAYFAQGRFQALLTWRATLAIAPARLCYRCAIIWTDHYEYDHALEELAMAHHGFMASTDLEGLVSVELQRAWLAVQRGEYAQAVQLAQPLLETAPDTTNIRGRARNTLAIALLRLGQVQRALALLQEAIPLYRAYGDAYALSQVLQNLGIAHSRLGQFRLASTDLAEVVALRRALGSGGMLAGALNNLGFYYHRNGDYGEAEHTFQEGLTIARRWTDRRSEGALLWSLGDLQRDRGAFEEALRYYYHSLERIGEGEPVLRCGVLISLSTLRRWQQKWAEAAALAAEAESLAEDTGTLRERLLASLARCTAQVGDKRLTEELGCATITLICESFEAQGARGDLSRALLLRARVSGQQGNQDTRAALKLAQDLGSLQPLAAEIVHTAGWRDLLPTHEALTLEIRRLNAARVADAGQAVTPISVYSLRVQTLGHESVWRDGELLSLTEWQAAAARELFLYLLFHGPQRKEALTLMLWPDSSPPRARSNFHTTLYRARQAVGENLILFEEGRYLLNPGVPVQCDALQLERLVKAARLLSPQDVLAEDMLRRTVALYSGDFLPTLDVAWMTPRRERYRQIYLEALWRLARCVLTRRDFASAEHYYRQALQCDPLREDMHRALMRVYAAQGERARIRAQLEHLTRLLAEELAVTPSPKTLALARKLLNTR